jgi:hypothetical protein
LSARNSKQGSRRNGHCDQYSERVDRILLPVIDEVDTHECLKQARSLSLTRDIGTEILDELSSRASFLAYLAFILPTSAQVKLDTRDLGFCDVGVTKREEETSQNRLPDVSPTPCTLR